MLNSKIPVLAAWGFQIRVDEVDIGKRAIWHKRRIVRDNGGWRSNGGQRKIGVGERGKGKRRIATRVAKQVAEDSVMEDAVADSDGGAAVLEGIPRETDARLEIIVLIVVERVAGAWADDGKGEGTGPAGIGEEIGDVVVHFEGDAEIFITEAVVGG